MAVRQRMIVGARELVRSNGFEATSFRDVLELTGTPRGSVYHYFPDGKQELGLAVIELHRQIWLKLIADVGARGATARDFIVGLVTAIADDAEASRYRFSCPVQAVTVDAAGTSEPLREAAAAAFTDWIEQIADVLRDKGLPRPRALGVAEGFAAALLGSTTMAKAMRSAAPIRAVADSFATVVAADS